MSAGYNFERQDRERRMRDYAERLEIPLDQLDPAEFCDHSGMEDLIMRDAERRAQEERRE